MNNPEKTLDYYMALPYPIELIPDEEGYWFARIPLLVGCMTNGVNQADALELIEDAKRAWLTDALAEGETIPEPEVIHLR